MSSNKKLFSPGWILGILLGLACSAGVVYAGSIGTTYTTATPVDVTLMNDVKTAVNDNDTRVTAIGAGTQTCLAGMTRVGPTCVDTVRQGPSVSWETAVNTCRLANKRLLAPSEYIAARTQDAAGFGMNTNGQLEWVNTVGANFYDGSTPALQAGRLTVGYMGPATGTGAFPQPGGNIPAGEIFYATNAGYDDASLGFVYFRCAR